MDEFRGLDTLSKPVITFKLVIWHHEQAVSLVAIRKWSFGVVKAFELHYFSLKPSFIHTRPNR